jgi:hypothetical protein
MRRENVRRNIRALGNAGFRDSITFSDKELETMTEQDIQEFLEMKAQQYADFLAEQSAISWEGD